MAEVASPSRLERSAWPPRARIRGVAPIGVGTPWVESASGILVRTAALNQVSVRVLVERFLARAAARPGARGESAHDIASLGRDLMRRPQASVNGGWGTARAWVDILGEATRQPDLESTTLLPWGHAIQPRGLLRDHRAYCPACLLDWEREGRPPYEPLRWQIQALEACVVHGVRLRTHCVTPGCGRARAVVAGWASIERCVGCRRKFAMPEEEARRADTPLAEHELDWARFVDGELSDIVSSPPAAVAGGGAPFSSILAVALETVSGGAQRAFAERIGMTDASVSYWKGGSKSPSLAAMLRVCRAAGLRLRDVLLGDLEAVRASEAPEGRPYVAPSLETHRALDPGDMKAILRAAMAASPPPSLASVFADASVDRSYARRRWPHECATVRERRREWLARQRALVRAERIRQIIAAVESLTEIGIYPSRNQMKELIHGVWLRRPEFEAAWKDAVVANGWGDPSDLRRLKGSPTPTPSRQ